LPSARTRQQDRPNPSYGAHRRSPRTILGGRTLFLPPAPALEGPAAARAAAAQLQMRGKLSLSFCASHGGTLTLCHSMHSRVLQGHSCKATPVCTSSRARRKVYYCAAAGPPPCPFVTACNRSLPALSAARVRRCRYRRGGEESEPAAAGESVHVPRYPPARSCQWKTLYCILVVSGPAGPAGPTSRPPGSWGASLLHWLQC
jgi:hypothetical protein